MAEESKESVKAPRKRSWTRRLGWAAVVVVALVGLGILGLWQGVPAVAKHVVMPRISERLNGEATLDEATFNPFTLRLELSGIEVVDDAGQPVAGVTNVVADAEWQTLWTWVPTLSELTVTDPRLSVDVDAKSGRVNVIALMAPMRSAGPAGSQEADEAGVRLPEVWVKRLVVTGGAVSSRLTLPPPREPFEHEIGPFDLDLADVKTAPGEQNGYAIQSALPGGASAEWTGTVVLHDLSAKGDLTVTELNVPLYNTLLDGQLGLVLDSGRVDVEIGYDLKLLPPDPSFGLELRRVDLRDLACRAFDADEPFYQLTSFSMSDIEADVTPNGPGLRVGQIDIGEGVFEIDRMPGKPPPLQDLLKMLLHQGFADLADQIKADMTRVEGRAEADDAAVAESAGEPVADATSGSEIDRIASELAARAAANGAIPLTSGELSVRELLIAALGPWRLELEQIAIGPQSSSLHGEPFVGFKSASIAGVTTRTQPLGFEVQSASAVEPWGEFVLTDAGELLIVRDAGARVAEAAAATPDYDLILKAEPGDAGGNVAIYVGEASATGGRLTLVDRGADPPLRNTVERIDGRVTGLSSQPDEMAEITFSAWVNERGATEGHGSFALMTDPIVVDLTLISEGIVLVPFSRYGDDYLGYEIDRGDVSTESTIKLVGTSIDVDTHLVLDDFYLGDKVESDKALKVPVKLGLSLLRDRDGVIDIDVPVDGDLSDPKVDATGIVRQAITNLFTKIVAAPFDFIASAFGGDADGEKLDLSRVAFEPGSATPGATAERKLGVLRTAMTERPGLTLIVSGEYDPAEDGEALRREALDARVREWIAQRRAEAESAALAEGRPLPEPPTHREAIDAMFAQLAADGGTSGEGAVAVAQPVVGPGDVEAGADPAAGEAGETMRHRVVRGARGRGSNVPTAVAGGVGSLDAETDAEPTATEASAEPTAAVDGLSYEQKFALVMESLPLPEPELIELATQRADAIVGALRDGDPPIDADRVKAGEPEAGETAVTFSLE